MATTGNVLTDILIIWLPLALIVVMGLVGLLRGVAREAIVSFSIVLAALVVSVWSGPWASDLHDTFSGLNQQDTQTWLGVIVLVLASLVIGYGMSSAIVSRGKLTGMSRLGGLLLGLANGAALGGWIIRNYFLALQLDLSGSNNTILNTLTDNIITRVLIIWAGWFPLVVAIVAAIVTLIGPFRRAQTVVATPSAQSNWTPSTAPAVTAGGVMATGALPTSYTPQYGQQYGQSQQLAQQQYNQPYGQPYQPQFGAQPQVSPSPSVQAAAASPYSSYGAPQPSRMQDAPPTMPMPASDLPRASAGGQETHYFGGSPAASGSTSTSSSGRPGTPDTGPLGDLPADAQAKSAPTPDASWLAAPRTDPASSTDSGTTARAEAPTLAYQVNSTTGASSSASGAVTNCPRCGALVPADAAFCTECGNRMKS